MSPFENGMSPFERFYERGLMNFNNIIGQTEIILNLKNSLTNDRIGHAYIFSGPVGIGKRTVAEIFASLLLCRNPLDGSVCGKCQACMLLESGSNPDFRRIQAEGASIGVEEIRDIQGDVVVRPMYSPRKVYIIEEADKMTVQAQNCLLKTLEEPPPYVVIILTASNYEALLETIRSRSQRLKFKKNSYEQVRQAIEHKYGKEIKGIEFAASYADGVIGTALELAGTGEIIQLREKTAGLLAGLQHSKLSDIFNVFGFFEENREYVDIIFDMMVLFYRDMIIMKETGNEKLLINSDKKDIILNNAPAFPVQKLVANIDLIEAARRAIKQNANYQLAIENMLIKLRED
jgi:DNA polymerase III subunit delta'